MRAYYNEFDPFAAAWLRNLIAQGLIAPGDVDERSIKDVHPDDLRGYTQCHFFAGIGGWSYAARLAGWDDDRPLWTGSCPCQPFSVAGQGRGADDPRHLWPDFLRLIAACRPAVVMGEQVAGKAGYGWFDGVRADLAREDYASRGVDIPACAVDAPHIRQRLYWIAVADAGGAGRLSATSPGVCSGEEGARPRHVQPERLHGVLGALAHPDQGGPGGWPGQPAGDIADRHPAGRQEVPGRPAGGDEGCAGLLEDARSERYERGQEPAARHEPNGPHAGWVENYGRAAHADQDGRNGTFWSGAEWIACHDGKARRAGSSLSVLVDGVSVGLADRRGPGTAPGPVSLLAHGVTNRVQKWRGFGNAIVPQLAAEVIGAFLDGECGQ